MANHIELRGIGKCFQAVEALTEISFSVEYGKIHSLVGENGAGKSTLGKVICGLIQPDTGEIFVDGSQVNFNSPYDALKMGITTITQELTILPQRSVIDNVFLGIECEDKGFFVQNSYLRKRFDDLNQKIGFSLIGDEMVGSMRLSDQKKVEILRALARNAKLIVMDEPTAAMSANEAEILLEFVRKLSKAGTTIIFISHFLKEVSRLSDSITVLRNGQIIRTSSSDKESPESLVKAMSGRDISLSFPTKDRPTGSSRIMLSVKGLSRKPAFRDVTFNIRQGEIVGFAGLAGSGRSEIARAIFGVDKFEMGSIEIGGKRVNINSPRTAIDAGISLLPESRKLQGLIMCFSVAQNISIPYLKAVSIGPFIKGQVENLRTKELLKKLDVRPPIPEQNIASFSGGNQQKVLFAKWLFKYPRIFIADEPTRGVDVGAKLAIYNLLISLSKAGIAVLLISSELEEVLGLAHRVYALRLGKIVGEFEGSQINESAIMSAVFATEKKNGE